MSVPTIDQILTPMTPAQARAKVQAILIAAKIPANLWVPNGVASTLLTGAGNILSMLSGELSRVVSGYFLPTAAADPQGGLIALLAQYLYGIPSPQPTFASGQLTLTNVGGAIYSGSTYGTGRVFFACSANGQAYTNVTPLNLGPVSSSTASQIVTIQATVPGSIGNANPGTVTTMTTALLGVSCSNAASIVGLDAPNNSAMQALCLASIGFRSNRGPGSAYAYAISGLDPVTGAPLATNTLTGLAVNINRWTPPLLLTHTNAITIYIASPTGIVDPNDLAGVIASIAANATPDGITVTVLAAQAVAYNANITPWVRAPSSVTAATLQAAIASAITSYIASTDNPLGGVTVSDDANPGGFTGLTADTLKGVIQMAVASVTGCRMMSVQGLFDLPLTPNQVAVNGIIVNPPRLVSAAGGS